MVAGLAWTAIAVQVVIPHFNHGSESELLRALRRSRRLRRRNREEGLHRTRRLLSVAFDHRGFHYLLDLLLPLAALSLLAPLLLVALVPELGAQPALVRRAQSSIHYHYVAGEIPVLFAAAAWERAGSAGGPTPRRWSLSPRRWWATTCSGRSRSGASSPAARRCRRRSAQRLEHDHVAARELALSLQMPRCRRRTRSGRISRSEGGSTASRTWPAQTG